MRVGKKRGEGKRESWSCTLYEDLTVQSDEMTDIVTRSEESLDHNVENQR